MLGNRLRLSLGQRCNVCEELVNDERRTEDTATGVLFGVKDPYVICPGCWQEVPPAVRDDLNYRRRARVAYHIKYGRVLRVP